MRRCHLSSQVALSGSNCQRSVAVLCDVHSARQSKSAALCDGGLSVSGRSDAWQRYQEMITCDHLHCVAGGIISVAVDQMCQV